MPTLQYSLYLCLSFSCHKGELQDKKVFITGINVSLYFSRSLKCTKDNMKTNTLASADRNDIWDDFFWENIHWKKCLQLIINDLNMKIFNTELKSVYCFIVKTWSYSTVKQAYAYKKGSSFSKWFLHETFKETPE